ncbi:methyltransferase family protein [Fodinibius halophilus]|uniref:Isoprenylcysteine carboxylmethyltransferase family protein n=1 Tax=Fodinibius halophilus TaxID=1736908 RepID=A0A6M1T5P4_9BACT|nr:isoprenylcysteine carboxylmethyltransferase family protein [Fodinibius halophilus]NGP89379.1 isoprenylcysteine carboxylmethyltransferase family protein [Fodinibius halophilus]
MEQEDNNHRTTNATRSAFWASILYYGLIAFEFFYMFSPFAAYIYSIYGPGLQALNLSESTSWLIGFFMPHIARESQSLFITWHEVIGMTLFLGGLTAFLIGAAQIYWNKLTKSGAVFGGIYHYIRHPQYLALMISSFGMVLVWPRYLVLFGFVTVCFAYFFLAKIEERKCKQTFADYENYRSQTGMFLPQGIEKLFHYIPRPQKRIGKIIGTVGFYVLIILLAFTAARGIHGYTVSNLYTYTTEQEVYLSLGKLNPDEIAEMVTIIKSDSSVVASLNEYEDTNHRFINYVMPASLFVSEVPMAMPEGTVPTHEWPSDKNQSHYKIIFSLAHFGPNGQADGQKILLQAINKTSVLEVWIDRKSQSVEKVFNPPVDMYYEGMLVPVF